MHHPGARPWPVEHIAALRECRPLIKKELVPPVCPRPKRGRPRRAAPLRSARPRRVRYWTIGEHRRRLAGGQREDLIDDSMRTAIQDLKTGPRIRRG
jgi:hypothetical protein